MLAIDPKRVAAVPVVQDAPEEHISLRDVLSFLRRNLFVVSTCVVAALSLGGAYVATAPSNYTAEARLIIDVAQSRIALQDPGPYSLVMESAQVDSEVEIVKSRAVALAVIEKLDLADEPEYNQAPGLLMRLKRAIKVELFGEPNGPSGADDDEIRRAMSAYYARLGVRRLGQSYVLEISFSSTNARRAAEIANAVVDAYIAAKVESKSDAARRGAEWLEIRLDELGRQANRAAADVERFKATRGIVTAATGGSLAERQLMDTSTRLLEAQGETTKLKARLDAIDAMLASGEVSNASVADASGNAILVSLRQRMIDAVARRSETVERYGVTSSAASAADRELDRIRDEIRAELYRVRKLYSTDLEAARLRQTSTDGSFETLLEGTAEKSGQYVRLSELESQAATYRRMYETMLQQFTQTVQRQSFPVSDARIVTPAVAPFTTSQPKSFMILCLSGVLGAVLGFSLALGREALEMRVFSPGQVERLLGLSCLGSLPRPSLLSRLLKGVPGLKGLRARDFRTVLIAPHSRSSQLFVSTKVSLGLVLHQKMPIQIGIAGLSADPRRSRLASNLAFLYAAEGTRTLLVDADASRLALTQCLAPKSSPNEAKVSEAASDGAASPELPAIARDIGGGLDFLSLSQGSVVPDPHRSLIRLRNLLSALREDYDVIILDLPPLSDSSDARALAPVLDAIVLDCVYLGTSQRELGEAVSGFGPYAGRIKGFVFEGLSKGRIHG